MGEVPEGDWLNYTAKLMVKQIDQMIIEMFVQQLYNTLTTDYISELQNMVQSPWRDL